jgi:hypothetical protein
VINLPMTRLDIADYLGLTIETVSRTITKPAGQGILSAGHRHEILVLKKAALVQRAGEDEADADGSLDDTPRVLSSLKIADIAHDWQLSKRRRAALTELELLS